MTMMGLQAGSYVPLGMGSDEETGGMMNDGWTDELEMGRQVNWFIVRLL